MTKKQNKYFIKLHVVSNFSETFKKVKYVKVKHLYWQSITVVLQPHNSTLIRWKSYSLPASRSMLGHQTVLIHQNSSFVVISEIVKM